MHLQPAESKLHLLEDLYGVSTKLHFVRTKDGHEVDFLAVINKQPYCLIEAKLSDDVPSKYFAYFAQYFTDIKKVQLVKGCKREQTYRDGLEVRDVVNWLYNIDFSAAAR